MSARQILNQVLFAAIIMVGIACVFMPSVAAQTRSDKIDTIEISEAYVRAEMNKVAGNTKLDSAELDRVIEIYKSALTRIADGKADKESAGRFKNNRAKAQKAIEDENNKLKIVQIKLNDPSRDLFSEYSKKNLELAELEQKLAEENANLNFLQDVNAKHQTDRAGLDQFSTDYPNLRADNDAKIAILREQLGVEKTGKLTTSEQAALVLAKASLYARLQNNKALNERNNGLALENSLLAAKISHTASQISHTSDIVTTLQIMTGSARTSVAKQRREQAERALISLTGIHPFLESYAKQNVEMSIRLLDIAHTEEDLPASEKKIARQKRQVEFDSNIANQIIGTKKTSRSYGLHLRQLRQKQPRIPIIKTEIKARSVKLQDVLFQKIINQEALDIFNATPLDISSEVLLFEAQFGPVDELQEGEITNLRGLYNTRRDILNALASYSEIKRKNLSDINTSQENLLDQVTALCALLDSRLLWLPSTEPLSFSWPSRVLDGIKTSVFGASPKQILSGFWSGFKQNFFFIFLAMLIVALSNGVRERFSVLLSSMGSRVGRVQKDSYSLTPVAVLDGIFQSIPWVLLPIIIGLIFSDNGLGSRLAMPFMQTCLLLSGLIFVFMTMRAWSQKSALFDLHFKVDQQLRSRLVKNLPWLLLTQAISIFLIGLTRYNLDYDSGASALGVLGFLIGSVSIAVFTVKIAWGRRKTSMSNARDTEGIYLRNEKWFFLVAITVPLITALLAMFGYYETSRLLLSRFFMSFCVLIAAYVLHGLFRRTVLIAQRRLALEQARTRRDQAVQTRMDKVAAEERGEIPIPKLDYDRIDLETINRQSSQLVNVVVFIVTVGVLWALWSSLLPALSVFNDVQAWGYDKVDTSGRAFLDTETGLPVHVTISYWNLMQAFGIGLITWLAARNLPGFLEIFILKRMRMQQSSRFAIVTVLGYLIFIIGVLIAFDKLGTQWSQLQWIVAALSVGIGLGLQAIFANFVSGLIILFERPVRIGDYITVGDISGTVTRIQIRATTLMDLDNKEILIPNQELVSQQVVNWTLGNSVTRLKINVGIAYGSDTELAHDVMLETVRANPNILNNPEPTALFLGFGDSTLDFEIRVFLRDFGQRFVVSHELHMALDKSLRQQGIEIAFPQRDLHVKNLETILPPKHTNKPKRRKPNKKTS